LMNGNSTPDVGGAHTATKTATSTTSPPFPCSGCGKSITDQFLLRALDVYWHEDCLKCGCCDCRLGEVGSTLYTRANLILCKRDYLRLFGTSGNCAACCKVIPAFEMVMRAKSNVYHLDCFACQQCHQRFCVGDRFYLAENRILCEYDYEERMIFANMSSNSTASLAHIQRRVTDIQSGNGAVGHNGQAGRSNAHPHGASFHPLDGRRAKHGSPSDGSSSGYGSPDSVLLEER